MKVRSLSLSRLSVFTALTIAIGLTAGCADDPAESPKKETAAPNSPIPTAPVQTPVPAAVVSTDTTFSLNIAEGQFPLLQGATLTIPVKITRGAAQVNPMTFFVSGLPTGVTASNLVTSGTATEALLLLTAAANATVGAATLNVRAVAGTVEQAKPVQMLVQANAANATAWCKQLVTCCNQLFGIERAACAGNALLGSEDSCKLQLTAYFAGGTCDVEVR